METSLSFTFGAGKVGYCLGCTRCSVEYPTYVTSGAAEVGLNAVAISNAIKDRSSYDLRVRKRLKIKPELRSSLKAFEESGQKLLFVKSIPPCYQHIKVEIYLDAQKDPHYTIAYPTKDGPQMKRKFFDIGFKTTDFKFTRKGSNDVIDFHGSNKNKSLTKMIRSVLGKQYGEFKANNVSAISDEVSEIFFSQPANRENLSSYEAFETVQKQCLVVEKMLKPPPSEKEIETSDKLSRKLDQLQQNTLKILESVLKDQDCHLLVAEHSENTESLSESLNNFFFAGNWRSYTTDHSKSKFVFPVPKGALLNDLQKVEDAKTKRLKHLMHHQFRTSLNTAEDKDVFVDVNSEKFIAEVTITESGKETGKKLKDLAKKHKKLVDLKILADVKKNQILCPVFNLTPSDLDASGDWVYTSGCYERKTKGGLAYIQPNNDWVRIGLNTSKLYPDTDWLSTWGIGFHGSSHEGDQAIAGTREFKTSGRRQIHEDDEDVNPVSSRRGKPCGGGAYFAEDPQVAAAFADQSEGKVAGRYCVFEVRIKPSETRIPVNNESYRIVNEKEFARPSGICVHVGHWNLFEFGVPYKQMLRDPLLKASKENVEPERYFIPQICKMSDESNKFRYSQIYHTWVDIDTDVRPKVILVVGSSQSGKSTVVNGILNCLFDIRRTDFYRFEVDRDNKRQSAYREARSPMRESRTHWLSGYLFQSDQKIFVIDTPGFDQGDVRANFESRLIQFLTSKTAQMYGLDKVDALCLVSDSSRNSSSQFELFKFNCLSGLFQDSAANNLVCISTNAMRKSGNNDITGFRFVDQLSVDNSVLFEDTRLLDHQSKSLWDSNNANYKRLLDRVCNRNIPPATLKNLNDIVNTRPVDVERAILDLQQTIFELLDNSANLDRERKKLDQMREQINAAGDFTYSEVVYERKKLDKNPGQHVTVCLKCAWNTCHDNCAIEQDREKYECAAMDDSQREQDRCCRACKNKCHWSQHSNTPFYYEIVESTVSRSLGHWLNQYRIGLDDVAKGEKVVAELKKSIGLLLLKMHSQIDDIKNFLRELRKYDVRQNDQFLVESGNDFVDELIAKEKRDAKMGFNERVDQLESIKKGEKFLKGIAGLCG